MSHTGPQNIALSWLVPSLSTGFHLEERVYCLEVLVFSLNISLNISMLELRLDRALSLFSTPLPVNQWQQYYSQTA